MWMRQWMGGKWMRQRLWQGALIYPCSMLAPNMIFCCRHGQGKATTTTATWFVHNPAIISALGSLWLVAVDLSQKLRQDVLMPTQLGPQRSTGQRSAGNVMPSESGELRMGMGMGTGIQLWMWMGLGCPVQHPF